MGNIPAKDGVRLHYDEFGTGDRIILSAQAGFYPDGMQQELAGRGYHVYCMTLRGFAPSGYVTEDYGDGWYDVFADDVICLTDALGIGQFFYMGASHGAGVENGSDDEFHQFIITEGTALTISNDGTVRNNQNQNMCLAFTVDDIDREYERVQALGARIVEPPAKRPWGAVNMSFYDPDNNMVFFRCFPDM